MPPPACLADRFKKKTEIKRKNEENCLRGEKPERRGLKEQ
jgi:hypothetical protein